MARKTKILIIGSTRRITVVWSSYSNMHLILSVFVCNLLYYRDMAIPAEHGVLCFMSIDKIGPDKRFNYEP
jgi:hypothetical protein